MASAGQIESEDYIAIAKKIYKVLGPGSGSYGYGQTTQTPDYTTDLEGDDLDGVIATAAQWDKLRYDLSSIFLHLDGEVPNLVEVKKGMIIDDTAADPLVNYNTYINNATANRFGLGPGQYTLTQKANKTYTSNWNTRLYSKVTFTFNNATEARYFFNSGGKLRLTSSRTGGDGTQQDNVWSTLLSTTGIQEFGAATNQNVNFYTLTTSYQTYYEETASTPYSANSYKLEAKCDVANNSSGTATEVSIRISWIDNYVESGGAALRPPYDNVTGTLSLLVEEVLPYNVTGLFPNNNPFVVAAPATYSIGNISATDPG